MIGIRPARETDDAGIRELIRLVGLIPVGLDWKRFILAVNDRDEILGCGQIKPHAQGIKELASIAVYPEHQGQGIGRAIVEHLLQDSPRPLYLMCESSNGPFYEKFGFRAISYAEMPRYFQRISRAAGMAAALARRKERLLIMKLQ